MSTHRVPIILTSPEAGVYLEPKSIVFTSSPFPTLQLWCFPDTSTLDEVAGEFTVPQNYVDTANVVVEWTADVTSGVFLPSFKYRAYGGDDAEGWNQATVQETVGSTDGPPTTALNQMQKSYALTDINFLAGDTVYCLLGRNGAGADTIADKVYARAWFEYNDA